MSQKRQEELEATSILRQMLDDLATRLVLSDGSCADPWIDDVATALARIGAMAELGGRLDLHSSALELEHRAGRARRGEEDRSRLEPDLRSGVSRLQEALDCACPVPADVVAPSAGRAANALAQDHDLVSDFILESREHLSNIETQLLALEQNPQELEALHSVFRGFHTIKGLAGFLEFSAMQEVAHEVETLLDQARNARLAVTPAVIDAVLAGADYVTLDLGRVERELNGDVASAAADDRALLAVIRALMSEPASPDPKEASAADLRQLSQAVADIESTVPVHAPSAPRENKHEPQQVAGAVKVDTAKLDYLVDMVGEMVIADSILRHNPELAEIKNTGVLRALAQLGRMTGEVQKTAMSMRMVTIGHLFQKMARLVRDLSRKHGKQVELETAGEDTELDRNIVEELADPLMHMVRNAIDHGIEAPDSRREQGKNAIARVALRAAHRAGHICIEVSDDGRGLDREKILAKAREKGLIQSGDHLSENEIFNLIFEPGFSTADRITDISGRGVGMDVVRKKIQRLRGRVEIQSTPGRGSTFLMKLPLTLAIIDGLVVAVGQERYIVPVFAVKEMLRPAQDTISTVENRGEMALVRGRLYPVVRLCRRFRVVPRSEEPRKSVLIITESAGKEFCLMVDQVIGKQEVVIKSLGETMKNVAGVAGGAILGDGRVGLILDMEGIYAGTTHV